MSLAVSSPYVVSQYLYRFSCFFTGIFIVFLFAQFHFTFIATLNDTPMWKFFGIKFSFCAKIVRNHSNSRLHLHLHLYKRRILQHSLILDNVGGILKRPFFFVSDVFFFYISIFTFNFSHFKCASILSHSMLVSVLLCYCWVACNGYRHDVL